VVALSLSWTVDLLIMLSDPSWLLDSVYQLITWLVKNQVCTLQYLFFKAIPSDLSLMVCTQSAMNILHVIVII